MKYQFVKKTLAAIIVFITILTPVPTFAASNLPNIDSNNIREENYTGYEAVNEVAKEKAKVLTTIYGNTSVQYALIDNGKIIISGQAGVYSKQENTVLTGNHMYGIGSISKIVTTAAVLNLIEEGKVNLDAPVTSYIKDFKMDDPRYTQITVRMLLNHSSGIMGSTFTNAVLIGDNDTFAHDNFLNQLSNQRLKANPGEFSVYCNDGFTLAEILIERVSGLDFTQYIKNYFTMPLNMEYTKTPKDVFSLNQLTKVYYPGFSNPFPADSFNAIGAGGIYSSAGDLCRFSQIFMKDSNNILTENSKLATEMKEYENGIWPEEGDTTTAYGLGWDCVNTYPFNQYGIKALYKGGDTLFYHSSLIVLPDYNMAVAVLSSGGVSTYNQLFGQEILLSTLKEKEIISKIKEDKFFYKPIAAKIPNNLKKYEGIYGTIQGLLQIKFDEDDNLIVSYPNNPNYLSKKYTYTTDGTFVTAWGKNYTGLKFIKEDNEKIYIQNMNYSYIPELGQTANIYYVAQKLSKNDIAKEVQSIWSKRNNKKYLLLNEKYTSQAYVTSSIITGFSTVDNIPGYYGNATIINENLSKTLLEIPVVHGRDLNDYTIIENNGKEYLEAGSYLFIAQDCISALSENTINYTIDKDGYALWYKIDKSLEGKEINVELPDQAAFALYNKDGICVNYSYLDGKNTATLPQDGYIVFIGNSSAKFQVNYNK